MGGKLNACKVETAKSGKHVDGKGLMLIVSENGRQRWVFRFSFRGRWRDMGFSNHPFVGLAEAREDAGGAPADGRGS